MNKKSVLMTYQCPVKLKHQLDLYCKIKGQTKSEVIRRAVVNYIKQSRNM